MVPTLCQKRFCLKGNILHDLLKDNRTSSALTIVRRPNCGSFFFENSPHKVAGGVLVQVQLNFAAVVETFVSHETSILNNQSQGIRDNIANHCTAFIICHTHDLWSDGPRYTSHVTLSLPISSLMHRPPLLRNTVFVLNHIVSPLRTGETRNFRSIYDARSRDGERLHARTSYLAGDSSGMPMDSQSGQACSTFANASPTILRHVAVATNCVSQSAVARGGYITWR